jgi:hypothetical protein
MAFREIQSKFSLGELDPILISRGDFEGYYNGARRLRNVITLPQGAVSRRWGLDYKYTVVDPNDSAIITDPDLVSGFVYDFNPAKRFLMVVTQHDLAGADNVAFSIYLDDVLQATVVSADYTSAQISGMYFLRGQDRVLVLHKDVAPHQLKRGADDMTWTFAAITFNYLPTYDFSLIDGTTYRGATDTFTPSATTGVGITVTAANAVFTAGHIGGLFFGNGGIFRITAVNAGGTIATGDTIEDFSSTAAIKGANAVLTEVAWGDAKAGPPAVVARGWPSKGEIFQNRLVLGGTPSLLNSISFSSSGDFYNFDDSEALDTNAFTLGIGSDGNDEIQDIVSSKGLVVIGSTSIYSSSMFLENPITPANAFVNEQDEKGAAPSLLAHVLDNQIFYIDDNTNKMNAASFDLASNSLVVFDASILSAHLITDPVSTAVYKPADNNGTLLLVVNEDGTLAQFQSLINQSIQAWTLATTHGTFEKVFSSRENSWALVKRSLGTAGTVTGEIDNVYIGNTTFEGFTDITAASQSAGTNVDLLSLEDEYLLLGHDAPYFRVDLTFSTPANTDLELVWEYLDKFGDWQTFTVTDATTGFSGDGEISWVLDDDVPNWMPLDISKYLPTGASLPPDTIVGATEKFWVRARRGAPGAIDYGFNVDSAFASFTFITASLDDSTSNVEIFSDDNDYLVLGHRTEFNILNVVLSVNASADITATYEYLDYNGNWQTFVTATDTTTGFTGNGAITWDETAFVDWTKQTVNEIDNLFWIRIRRTAVGLVTAPTESTILLDITTTAIEQTIFINSAKRLYIEKMDYDDYTDSTETASSDANGLITGLTHLAAQQVYARVNSVPEGPFFVSDAGEITVSEASVTGITIGLNYMPDITPMPLVSRAFFSQNVYQPKHIKGVYVDYFESLGVTVNGFEIPDLSLNNFTLDQTPMPLTDFWEYTPMRGWDPRQEINITQTLPLPMTIIGIGYRMEIS